ncbi:hypothetical protein GCM10027277_01480 [Pseudoduganella ginsengisoli]|uniref:Uncharacterized protein n=1 Tax=Pseudoduganella ginsengisoli TaxID=1462440 RepID=A0A6L6QA79_9BURK|nr:hypothetical protein [Pseudoduganella ginsengisoli]MTW06098.1 hypothetical protein [Pseudoduganella ginsengisoli]
MNKRITTLLLAFATTGIGLYYWRTQQPSPYGFEVQYALTEKAIADLKPRALSGDCSAARSLSMHYLNAALNFEEGLHWSRVAAQCPDLLDKRRLIVLLVQLPRSAAIDMEIEKTVKQVDEIDPKESQRIRSLINEEREIK